MTDNELKELVGKRIELVEMKNDPYPVEPGTQGIVTGTEEPQKLWVDWDSGRRLALLVDIDKFIVLE